MNYRHLVDKLIELWDHNNQWKKNLENQEFKVILKNETTLMVKTFVLYCKNNMDEIDLIFKMLCVFSLRTSNDSQFLRKFYLALQPLFKVH